MSLEVFHDVVWFVGGNTPWRSMLISQLGCRENLSTSMPPITQFLLNSPTLNGLLLSDSTMALNQALSTWAFGEHIQVRTMQYIN